MGNLNSPYTPTHSGEVLKEEIEYRGVSQKELLPKLGISSDMLDHYCPLKKWTIKS